MPGSGPEEAKAHRAGTGRGFNSMACKGLDWPARDQRKQRVRSLDRSSLEALGRTDSQAQARTERHTEDENGHS